MQLRYEQLANHLQKNLAPLYLVSGDVPLLAQECCDLIRVAAKQQGYSERQVFQVETGFSWAKLSTEIDNFSLFATKQLFELRFTPNQLGDTGSKAIQSFANKPPSDKILLITTTKLDASQQKTAWMKAVSDAGVFIQLWPIPVEQLPQWIQQRLTAAGLQAEKDGIALLAARAEGNLLAAAQEIEKLSLLGHTLLTTDAIAQVVTDSARFDIFQLADAALLGDGKRVSRIIAGLENEGVEATLLLWALAREIRTLASIAFNIEQGIPPEQALQKQQVWEKRKSLVRKALQRHPATTWRRLLKQASKLDQIIKGLEKGNIWQELERLALRTAGIKI